MKFGFRKPSLKKRIAARTSVKRAIRHRLGLKAPRGWVWLTNPNKALYNRVYSYSTGANRSSSGLTTAAGDSTAGEDVRRGVLSRHSSLKLRYALALLTLLTKTLLATLRFRVSPVRSWCVVLNNRIEISRWEDGKHADP